MALTQQQMLDMYQQEMGSPGSPPANMVAPQQSGAPATLSLQDMMALHAQGQAVPQGQLPADTGMPQGFAQVPQPGQVPTATGAPSVLPNPDGTYGSASVAASVSGVPAISPITGQTPGAATFGAAQQQFNSATDEGQLANAAYLGAAGDEQRALATEGAGQLDLNQAAADKGEAMAGIDAERETQASAFEKRRKDMMAKFDKENAIQERRMQMAVEEAGNAQVHDFWADKSTGARILGIVAQALSGAANGLAGNPGAPTPLDRVINDDLQKQMANQQNKRAVAQQQQGMYQTMLQATGNRLDAETGMQLAANNRVAAMVTTLSDKMAVPEAAAKAKVITGQLEQRNAQIAQQRAVTQQGIAAQKVNYALNQMGDAEKLGVLSGAASAKAAGAAAKGEETYNPLPGTASGTLKNKTTAGIYAKQVKASEDIVNYLSSLENARQTIRDGGGLDAYYKIAAASDLQFASLRGDGMLALGKKLEGSEEAMAKRGAVGFLKSYIGGDITKADSAIEAYQMEWGRSYLNRLRAADPNVKLNFNAPVIGPILAKVVTQEARLGQKKAAPNGG